jgi:hypothetical protein
MSDSNNPFGNFGSFGKLVPGFDFLQGLATSAAKGASQSIPQMPNLGNWVAPTINVEELEKRIAELKAVQFWLDQNATALKATIQALEVQKMTLATLKGMNFSMGDVANAFKLKAADTVKSFSAAATGAEPPAAAKRPARKAAAKSASAAPAPGVVDPMQWWGALTQQFQTIAASAMKDAAKQTAMDVTKNMATGLAKDAVKSAMGTARSVGKGMADIATKTVAAGVGATRTTPAKASKKRPATRR